MTPAEEAELLERTRRLEATARGLVAASARLELQIEQMAVAVGSLASLLLSRRERTRAMPPDRELVLEQLLAVLADGTPFTAADLLDAPGAAGVVAHIAGRRTGAARRLGRWLGRSVGAAGGLRLEVVGRSAGGRVFCVRHV
jgi:hypothetical protein